MSFNLKNTSMQIFKIILLIVLFFGINNVTKSQSVPYYFSLSELNNTVFNGALYDIGKADIKTERLSVALGTNEVFPKKIYSLTNLIALRVSVAMNSGKPDVKSLSPEINSLTKLEHLYLQGLEVQNFPSNLTGLSALKTFHLSNAESSLLSFPNFNNFPNLNHCYIALNNNTNLASINNFNSIFDVSSIKELTLFACNLDNSSLNNIEKLSNLLYLELSNNKIENLSFLKKTNLLQVLKLSYNNLKSPLQDFYHLKDLVYLDLSNNKIENLPNEIKNLSSLKVLILDYNNLTIVPNEIGELANLEKLSLRGNNISNVPVELFKLTGLKWLDLSGTNIKSLPIEIINSNIERLEISSKTTEYFEFDAETYAKIKSLKVLSLSIWKAEEKLQKEKKKFRRLRPDVTLF